MKKLTAAHIDVLYDFTRKHYVLHYDLQTELVDHLANGIEKQWARKEELTFENALTIEFKKFGVFGFTEIIDKRQAAMHKRYLKIIGKHALQFMGSLKMVAFMLFTAVLILFTTNVPSGTLVMYGLGFAGCVASLVYIVVNMRKYRKKQEQENSKRWMFEELIVNYGMGTGVLGIPYYLHVTTFNHAMDFTAPSTFESYFIAIWTALTVVMFYLVRIEIPKMAGNYLAAVYPEYAVAK
jgi:hypothetical protein